MADLNGKNVLIISTEFGTEQAEIETPRDFLLAAGASVTVATPDGGTIQTVISDRDPADQVSADTTIADVADSDFDALVVPGGTVNADTLRQDKDAVALARRFATAGKPIAAICHAPWLLVEAGLTIGKTLTSFPSLRSDLNNAGATWVDREVVADDTNGFTLITSRNPDDLDAFDSTLAETLEKAGAAAGSGR